MSSASVAQHTNHRVGALKCLHYQFWVQLHRFLESYEHALILEIFHKHNLCTGTALDFLNCAGPVYNYQRVRNISFGDNISNQIQSYSSIFPRTEAAR